MKKSSYLVKIVPPFGYRVFRIEFTRRHIVFAALLSLVTAGAIGGSYFFNLWNAEMKVGELKSLTLDQRQRLEQIDQQATQLDGELHDLEQQNEKIRKMIGAGSGTPLAAPKPATAPDNRQSLRAPAGGDEFALVASRLERLRAHSQRVLGEGDRLRSLTLRVLNMKRLEELSRAQVLAAIPSINPADGAAVVSSFGWRMSPWPEFHKGVDLGAGYGDVVHAAAAGTVVAAGWDSGFGMKVDIDHGNGYHTWYCHLSRIDVKPGQYVTKTQAIALVGSTGESTGPHLHYQIMLDGNPVDPQPYLNGVPDRVLASLK